MSAQEPLFEILSRGGAGLSDVTRAVNELERLRPDGRVVRIGLSGNVTLDLLGTFLRKQALLAGHRAEIRLGNFDDHLGNVKRFADEGIDALVVTNFFDALMPAFEARIPLLDPALFAAQVDRFRNELGLILAAAGDLKHVFVPLLHRLTPPNPAAPSDEVDEAVAAFNRAIVAETAGRNVTLLSGASIAAGIGWSRAHDLKSYRRFRAPLSPAFLDELAAQIYAQSRGFGSYFYKALVLDGDNTLWGGILGEDLAAGIKLEPHAHPGSVFWQVQHQLLALQRRGVLLCLCSKNNPEDVEALLAKHPNMVLKPDDFVTKRVNWEDKVSNLKSIAAELNIGLDALVFVDDSRFECEAVRSQLPGVVTFEVPATLSDYPALIDRIKQLFAVQKLSAESADKTQQYKLRALAASERARYATQEEYLRSLGLKVTVKRDDRTSVARIAELTQKSNQFNLTTRRYTEAQIRAFMEAPDREVLAIHVADKFGDSGLTGVVIASFEKGGDTTVDTFLLSCRILGRGVEVSFWEALFRRARERGCTTVSAEYLKTPANAQAADFWSRLGLRLVSEDGGRRIYRADLSELHVVPPEHVEVIHVL